MSMMMGISSSNTKRLEIKDLSGNVVGFVTISRGQTQNTKKKRLPYSFKEISTRLLNTRKSGSAQQVLLNAKQKVISLRMMYKGGVYDDDEVFNALMHAQAIARVAKKRVNHLEEEERADKKGGPCEADIQEKTEEMAENQTSEDMTEINLQRMQKLMEQYEQKMQETMKELERLEDMNVLSDEMGANMKVSMDPEDLELLKKKHRADEMKEIMEADMKYLKAMFNKLEKEKKSESSGFSNSNSGSEGVSLELSGIDIPVETAPDALTVIEGGQIDAAV